MKNTQIVQIIGEAIALKKADEIKEALCALIVLLEQEPEPVSNGRLVYRVRVNERVIDPTHKYPKQMLACWDIVHGACTPDAEPVLTLEQVKAAIGENAEILQTKQDPYRIYAFYQKRMEDEGWISREKERVA